MEGNDEDDVGVWPRGGEHNVLLWSLETALETNIIIVILDTGRGSLLQCELYGMKEGECTFLDNQEYV